MGDSCFGLIVFLNCFSLLKTQHEFWSRCWVLGEVCMYHLGVLELVYMNLIKEYLIALLLNDCGITIVIEIESIDEFCMLLLQNRVYC